MKKLLLLILCCTTVICPGAAAKTEASPGKIDQLMQSFYLAPAEKKAEDILKKLAALPPALLIKSLPAYGSFLGELFAQYPGTLEKWSRIKGSKEFNDLFLFGLLYAKTPRATERYKIMTGRTTVTGVPPDADKYPESFRSPQVLDACRGGFFASGKTKYLDLIIDTAVKIPDGNRIDLTQRAALWSLISLSRKHPVVQQYAQKKLQKSYPQQILAAAKLMKAADQQRLLGKILIPDSLRSRGNLPPDFFKFAENTILFYQRDFLEKVEKLISAEIRRRYPELDEKRVLQITRNFLALKTPGIPRKSKEEYGFMEFLAIQKFMTNTNPNTRHKKRFIPYGLKLAQKYPESLPAAQLIFRGLKNGRSIQYITPETVKKHKLHPYLSLMLQGEYFMRRAWKLRGGGYADTVSKQGWTGFAENISHAAKYFEQAHKRYPQAPEAAAAMIEIALHQNRQQDNMVYYLKKALMAQADHFNTMSTYTWFSRPRWCGSKENLLADAKRFFALRKKHPRLARNGLHLLQAYLTEISAVENIRYFAQKENYLEVKDLFEKLSRQTPLSPGEKMFWGTAALLAGDFKTCQNLLSRFSPEDRAFAKTLRHGGLPQLYWFDFPALFKALKKQPVPSSAQQLESMISAEKNQINKKSLIELYIILHGNLDRLAYRSRMPGVYRLCSAFDSNREFLKKVLAMGADVEAGSPVTGLRPLYFGMKYAQSAELLTLLLKYGADPNANWGKHPPLYCSFLYNFKEERIRQLLAAGADPNRKFGSNFTALHGCVKKYNAVKLLIEYKADLNAVSKYGQTPLDLAEKYGSPRTVKLLRDSGAKKASEL